MLSKSELVKKANGILMHPSSETRKYNLNFYIRTDFRNPLGSKMWHEGNRTAIKLYTTSRGRIGDLCGHA
jgi:hypothetical protein